jgi:hypothetical protein
MPWAAGCAQSNATVSGTVKLDGKPLPGGIVTFFPVQPGGFPASAQISEQGHYEITTPPGEYRIALDNRELKERDRTTKPPELPPGIKLPPPKEPPPGKEAPPKKQGIAGRYVAFPPRYYSAEESALTYTVTGGSQTHDIELAAK